MSRELLKFLETEKQTELTMSLAPRRTQSNEEDPDDEKVTKVTTSE